MKTKKTIKEMMLGMFAAINRPYSESDWDAAYYVAENISRCYYRIRIEMEYNEFTEGHKTAREILNGFRKELWTSGRSVNCLVSASIDQVING